MRDSALEREVSALEPFADQLPEQAPPASLEPELLQEGDPQSAGQQLGKGTPAAAAQETQSAAASSNPANAFVCTICKAGFSKRSRLNRHMSVHSGERNFVCHFEGCNKKYARKSHLTRHIEGAHTNSRRFKCDTPGCSAAFYEVGKPLPRADPPLNKIHPLVCRARTWSGIAKRTSRRSS